MSKLLQKSLEAKMAALDGPEWDSSDDEDPFKTSAKTKSKSTTSDMEDDAKESIPAKEMKKQLKKKKKSNTNAPSNVLYLGHLPKAFEEIQMLTFFSQFGKVINLKVARSRKTGTPKGYGFIQFQELDVAAIVAETMNGYFLMGERRLVCHMIPKDKIHEKLFNGAKKRLLLQKKGVLNANRITHWQVKHQKIVNKKKSAQDLKKITKRLVGREAKKREMLSSLGIDYDFPGYAASSNRVKEMKENGSDKTATEKNEKGTEPMDMSTIPSDDTKASSKKSKKASSKKRKTSIDDSSNSKSRSTDKASDETESALVTPKKRKSSIDDSKTTEKSTTKKKKSKKKAKEASIDASKDVETSQEIAEKRKSSIDDSKTTGKSTTTTKKSKKKAKEAAIDASKDVETSQEIAATPKSSKKSAVPKTTDAKKKSKKEKKRRKSVA